MEKKQETPQIIPANARELHNIEFLAGLDRQLYEGQEILKPRLQKIPGAWRDFRLATTLITKLMDKVYATLPPKTLRHMLRLCSNGEIVIRPKPMIRIPENDVQIVTNEDLKVLINCCIAAECAMCIKDYPAQKKVPLAFCA